MITFVKVTQICSQNNQNSSFARLYHVNYHNFFVIDVTYPVNFESRNFCRLSVTEKNVEIFSLCTFFFSYCFQFYRLRILYHRVNPA